ncbi:ATP-binding protein [Desulfovibrio desulfuricans]|uniref:GAF domain-containing hybrid sensor histidine kinase/response regulator n=1 Tax=Desulfovibrio desulfuricans TaxID=876 RepID=UPI0035B12F15
MSDTHQPYQGNLANPLVLALEISSSALLHVSKEPFLRAAMASIGESLHCDTVSLVEFDDEQWSAPIVWRSSMHPDAGMPAVTLHDIAPVLSVFEEGSSLCVADTATMPEGPQKDLFLFRGVKSAICVPIAHDGQLFGGICLLRRRYIGKWTIEDSSLCHLLGNILAITLTHFRLYGQLQRKHRQLHDILGAFSDPVCIVDMETYKILFVNNSVEETCPHKDDSLSNICYKRFMGRETPCPFCTNAIIAASGEPYHWTYENKVNRRTYTIVDKAIKWDNDKMVRLSIARDVTDLLQTQHEKQNALVASQAKSEFLAHMSHEIRTPMNGIIGLTHLALQSNPSDDQKNYLQKIRSSATNLLAIINDILDLSKIEANKMVLENTNYPLEDVLEFVHTSLRFPIEQKGIEYICRVGDEVPLKLWGDSLRLKQVLLNLMSNAVKFTAEGRISLCIDRETAGDTDNLHFRITDTGMGISREYQQFLFDPYTQANASISRRFGGTGLGLSICKRIAELMHGSLWCESELGKGSTFHLSIPCTPARNVYCPPEHNTSIPMPLDGAEECSILVAEDNEINVEVLRAMLRQLGFECDVASNGKEALHMATETPYDIVLMDVNMPVMDGLTATRELRRALPQDKDKKSLPIIALTAATMPDNIAEIINAGMNDHIAKPFSQDILRKKLAAWLNLH